MTKEIDAAIVMSGFNPLVELGYPISMFRKHAITLGEKKIRGSIIIPGTAPALKSAIGKAIPVSAY